jgi:hypothetical protein
MAIREQPAERHLARGLVEVCSDHDDEGDQIQLIVEPLTGQGGGRLFPMRKSWPETSGLSPPENTSFAVLDRADSLWLEACAALRWPAVA